MSNKVYLRVELEENEGCTMIMARGIPIDRVGVFDTDAIVHKEHTIHTDKSARSVIDELEEMIKNDLGIGPSFTDCLRTEPKLDPRYPNNIHMIDYREMRDDIILRYDSYILQNTNP